MGPCTAAGQWEAAFAKYRARSRACAGTKAAASISVALYNNRCLPVLGYIAQLVPLPKPFGNIERYVFHHILHMATNALDSTAIFNLHTAGGPRIASGKAMAAAAMMRAATVTVTSWARSKQWLIEQAHEHLPVVLWMKGVYWPAICDSPAFAVSLAAAAGCFPAEGTLQSGALNARVLMDKQRRANKKAIVKVQSLATKCIREALYTNTLHGLFAKRLSALLPNNMAELVHVDWNKICSLLRSMRMHSAMCVIKTFTNSWPTTARYHHDTVLQCIFGCGNRCDELEHYLQCPRLWRVVRVHTAGREPSDPLERLALVNPNTANLTEICIAFTVYHAVRNSEAHIVENTLTNRNFTILAARVQPMPRLQLTRLGVRHPDGRHL